MFADPFALKALMQRDGSDLGRRHGDRADGQEHRPVRLQQAYALFETNEQRKLVLGRVAEAVLAWVPARTAGPTSQGARAACTPSTTGTSWHGARIRRMERGLGVDDRRRRVPIPRGTDAISVVTNSASGTKLDFYQQRTVTYDVRLAGGGTATASLSVDLLNDSPDVGVPALRDRSVQGLLDAGGRERGGRRSLL